MKRASRIPKVNPVKVTEFDKACWELSRAGKSPEQISVLMNCSVDQAEEGRLVVEMYLQANSRDIVRAALHEQAMIGLKNTGRVIADAQKARYVASPEVINPETGETVRPARYEPDHTIRLDAVRATADLLGTAQDKQQSTNINVGNQINVGANGSGRSFEQRVREKREQLGLNAAPPTIEAQLDEEEIFGVDETEQDGSSGVFEDEDADAGTVLNRDDD